MNDQIKPSVTNPTIADIYQLIDEDKLVLRPDFQRKFVWTHEHQEEFIDTILNGFPFPEIYVCEGDIDVEKKRTTRNVIDGQQRLTTIKNYIDGKMKPFLRIPKYEDLVEKEDFLSYQVVMRDIGRVDEATTREIFRRINLTKFQLDSVEIHNAVYDGEFIQAAKTILESIHLEKYGVLKESEFTRMADLHFVLLVISTVEKGGYFAQDKEVEPMIAKFNDEYPNRDNVISTLVKVFEVISDLELPVDSMWFRKSNFFTLVVELSKVLDVLPADIREKLLALDKNVMQSKTKLDSDYAKYYSYMYQATHARKARVVRSEYFVRECLDAE